MKAAIKPATATVPKLDPNAMHWAKTANHRPDGCGNLVTTTLCGLGEVPVLGHGGGAGAGRRMCARCVFLYQQAQQAMTAPRVDF